MVKNNYKLVLITISLGVLLIFWTSIKSSLIDLIENTTPPNDTISYHELKVKIDSLKYSNYSIAKYSNLYLDINLRLNNDLLTSIQSQDLITLCSEQQLNELKNIIENYLTNDVSGNSKNISSHIKNYKSIRQNFNFSFYESQIKLHDYYLNHFSNNVNSFIAQQQANTCWDSEQFNKYLELCKLKDINTKYKSLFSVIVKRNQDILDQLFYDYGSLPNCIQ